MMTPWTPPAPDAQRRRGPRVLSGATALVTGGSSGVGRAIALDLARHGARVLATARRSQRLAELAAESLPAGAPEILTIAADITSPQDRRAILVEAARGLGSLDIVVAAAGSGAVGTFAGGDPNTPEPRPGHRARRLDPRPPSPAAPRRILRVQGGTAIARRLAASGTRRGPRRPAADRRGARKPRADGVGVLGQPRRGRAARVVARHAALRRCDGRGRDGSSRAPSSGDFALLVGQGIRAGCKAFPKAHRLDRCAATTIAGMTPA